MDILNFVSAGIIPILIFYIVGYGLLSKTPVFESFVKGASKGFEIVIEIAPTIVGLMVAIGVMRNSGTLDCITQILKPVTDILQIPVELLPLSIIKMFSASGANGLLFDIFKQFGTDSFVGLSASILLSCTETLFYTISVYYMSIGIQKTRWTIPVGIGIALISLLVSVWIASYIS